jgi:uncharacterized membrane protein
MRRREDQRAHRRPAARHQAIIADLRSSGSRASVSYLIALKVVELTVDDHPNVPLKLIDLLALVVVAVLIVLVAVGVEGPVRAVLALVFVGFIPGWAVVTNWTSAGSTSRAALAVLLSLTMSSGAATTTLWLHVWHPITLFYVGASLSAAAIVFSLVRRRSTECRT